MKIPAVTGLILSAGKSGRIGKFKPLLLYKGKPFIINIIEKLEKICNKIIVVTGHNSDILNNAVVESLTEDKQSALLNKIDFVFNESFEQGMFTSLQKGVSETIDCGWILYHFVDQPGLPQEFYNNFAEQIDNSHNWIQPSYERKNGHPILIHKDLFPKIINASRADNLRDISRKLFVKKKYWECNFKEIFQDIDTEEDYNSAL